MFSSKSSRSSSLQSLTNGQKETDVPPPINVNVNIKGGPAENNDQPENPEELQYSDLSSDNALNPNVQLNFTRNHPMGKILIGLVQDSMQLAEKNNLRSMETNLPELCTNFYNAMMLEKNKTNRRILQTTAEIEANMINKELNSHTLNQNVEPPTYFSPVPTLLSPRQRADCMKLFPTGSQKFAGLKKENGMCIIEYLSLVKAAQAQCNLSEKEFKEMLLASTTGKPHLLLMEWIALNEDPATIFHSLMLHFDKRIQPEEARMQLYTYKAPKNVALKDVESHIMHLASRAATTLPNGPSRAANYNMEFIQGLIRSLPSQSSIVVQNVNNLLSARLGRAALAGELSKALNTYRHSIDTDIKLHGGEFIRKFRPTMANKIYPRQAQVSAYSVMQTQRVFQPKPAISQFNKPGQFNKRPMGSKQFTMRTGFSGQGANNGTGPRDFSRNNFSRNNVSKFGNNRFMSPKQPTNYCSLCGKKDHLATDGCPNMVNNAGKRVPVFPTFGTCQICPDDVSPRLNHPATLCPYRKGGPFDKTQ